MLSPAALLSILSLASSVLVDAAGYATRDPQYPSCTGFDTSDNNTRPLDSQDFIISTGVVCNVNGSNFSTPCDVLSGGWPTLQNVFLYANGSIIRSPAVDYRTTTTLGWTIWNATGDSNPYNIQHLLAVENQTVTFDNGTSGDVIFTPTYRCVTGRIQGCPSNFSLANETEVSACYPELTDRGVSFESITGHFENITILAGSRSINETSVEAAANLEQNPNNRPPYGLSSSGADAGVRFTGVGASSVLALVVIWLAASVL
ncbi:hypothetical protein E4T44_05513 [Aureobasidium sp. EXF-8845]|nr:hypothetical protein E4T44_05513 [Aureobasidium sp. EXF-8845]KAI4850586.1 hypothetical protein E4T45_05440 [Aureobasidium sp. EXF-8846]